MYVSYKFEDKKMHTMYKKTLIHVLKKIYFIIRKN